MTVADVLRESNELLAWLDRTLDGVALPETFRSRVVGGCLDLALDHHRAIVLTISGALYGSAFALVRVLFDTYMRGVWLRRCASEADLERYMADKFNKTMTRLIEELERLPGFECHQLSTVKTKAWKSMNSYTHSGALQIMRRSTTTTLEPNYATEEIQEVLKHVNTVGMMSAIEIAFLAENLELANMILGKLEWFDKRQQ